MVKIATKKNFSYPAKKILFKINSLTLEETIFKLKFVEVTACIIKNQELAFNRNATSSLLHRVCLFWSFLIPLVFLCRRKSWIFSIQEDTISLDMMCKIVVTLISRFYKYRLLQNDHFYKIIFRKGVVF